MSETSPLLQTFRQRIQYYGGSEKLATDINFELYNYKKPTKVVRHGNRKQFTPIQDELICENWATLSLRELSILVNADYKIVSRRAKELELQSRQLFNCAMKTVLNTVTGIYYTSIKEAAESKGIYYGTFRYQIDHGLNEFIRL